MKLAMAVLYENCLAIVRFVKTVSVTVTLLTQGDLFCYLLTPNQQTTRYISRTQPMTVETKNFRTTNNSHYSSDLSLVTVTDIVKYNNKI